MARHRKSIDILVIGAFCILYRGTRTEARTIYVVLVRYRTGVRPATHARATADASRAGTASTDAWRGRCHQAAARAGYASASGTSTVQQVQSTGQ